jgi:hypothetical protein
MYAILAISWTRIVYTCPIIFFAKNVTPLVLNAKTQTVRIIAQNVKNLIFYFNMNIYLHQEMMEKQTISRKLILENVLANANKDIIKY